MPGGHATLESHVARSMALVFALLAVGLIIAAYWALLFVGQRSLLFPAPPVAGAPPRPADAEPIWLETSAGRVEAWWLPPTASATGPCPALIFTHGNGELIDYWPDAFEEPRRWGLGVLLVEYPGYGRSQGRPSERTIRETILAADRWARERADIDAARIVPYGRSLGGSAAALLAAERPVPALILESAFTSARAFASQFRAPGFSCAIRSIRSRRCAVTAALSWCCTATATRSCPPITAALWPPPRRARRCGCCLAATTTARGPGPRSGPSCRPTIYFRSQSPDRSIDHQIDL